MSEKVKRLRPKRHDVIVESIKLVLDMPLGLSPEAKDALNDALGRFAQPEKWSFCMLNPDQQRLVLKAITHGEKPALTLRIWNAAISHVRYDTGEIMAGRNRLSEDADTTPQETSRALSRLTEIGALLKLRRGRYAINPHVGWTGSLVKRQEAAKTAPVLRVIDP